MVATGDDGEYLQRHDQGVLGIIPAAFFPYAFALEERPEWDQVEAAAPEELGGGGGPGALDMMRFDQVAYWLLDLHVDPVFDDPHGGGGGGPGALDMMQLDEVAYWLLDLHVDPVFDNPPGGGGPGALDRMHLDEVAADPHGDDDSTVTSTAAAESWAEGGGWEMQIDKGGDEEEEWVLRGHGAADDAATASTAESRIRGDDHGLQPYAICDCAAAAGDLSVECWWVPEPEPTGPLPDQLALDGDVFLQDLVLGDMQQLLV